MNTNPKMTLNMNKYDNVETCRRSNNLTIRNSTMNQMKNYEEQN